MRREKEGKTTERETENSHPFLERSGSSAFIPSTQASKRGREREWEKGRENRERGRESEREERERERNTPRKQASKKERRGERKSGGGLALPTLALAKEREREREITGEHMKPVLCLHRCNPMLNFHSPLKAPEQMGGPRARGT